MSEQEDLGISSRPQADSADVILYGRIGDRNADGLGGLKRSALRMAVINSFQAAELEAGGYVELSLPLLATALYDQGRPQQCQTQGRNDYSLLTQICKELNQSGLLQLKLGRRTWTYSLTAPGRAARATDGS